MSSQISCGRLVTHERSNLITQYVRTEDNEYGAGNRAIIAHIVNDVGVAGGASVAGQIRRQWPGAYNHYIDYIKSRRTLLERPSPLGMVCWYRQEEPIWIAHMFAQSETIRTNKTPFRMEDFKKTLYEVAMVARDTGRPLNMPYMIGCGLAGADWNDVERVIRAMCCQLHGVDVHLHKRNGR